MTMTTMTDWAPDVVIAFALAFALIAAVKLTIDYFIKPEPLAVYLPVKAVHRCLSAQEKRAFFPHKKKRK